MVMVAAIMVVAIMVVAIMAAVVKMAIIIAMNISAEAALAIRLEVAACMKSWSAFQRLVRVEATLRLATTNC